jgi:hypothetical protein
MVRKLTFDSRERSAAVHLMSARAALISELVKGFFWS